jgi:hypothetical protein
MKDPRSKGNFSLNTFVLALALIAIYLVSTNLSQETAPHSVKTPVGDAFRMARPALEGAGAKALIRTQPVKSASSARTL